MQATGRKSDEAKVESLCSLSYRLYTKAGWSQSRLGFVVESTCCIICSSDFLLSSHRDVSSAIVATSMPEEGLMKNAPKITNQVYELRADKKLRGNGLIMTELFTSSSTW